MYAARQEVAWIMDDALKRLADLRQVLLGMEKDFGLSELSETETKVLYAARLLKEVKPCVQLSDLAEHPMLEGMSRSSFFRAIKTLIEHGFITKSGSEKRAGYLVHELK